jgi:hypothetical protein
VLRQLEAAQEQVRGTVDEARERVGSKRLQRGGQALSSRAPGCLQTGVNLSNLVLPEPGRARMNLSCLDGAAVRFSFTASRTAVQGMQPLLRADLGRWPDATQIGDCDSGGRGEPRRFGGDLSRRCRDDQRTGR